MRDRVMFGLMAALAAGVLAAPLCCAHAGETFSAEVPTRPSASVCAPWKQAASQTMAQLAQAGPGVDVLRVSEAVAGMRRADRLCTLGFFVSACREYDAIVRGVPGRLHAAAMPDMCLSVTRETPAS